MGITRRDFLNGTALVIGIGAAATLLPWRQLLNKGELPPADLVELKDYYPPEWTGLRGDNATSSIVAHEMGWNKKTFDISQLPSQEHYDLVIVGAGLSGLSAAYAYQKDHPDARILLIDNHDDFGGHARRNEFHHNGKMILTYGGSESFDEPQVKYDEKTLAMLEDLGIDYRKFEEYFDQKFSEKHGLHHGIFYDKAHFGVDKVIAKDPYFGDFDASEAFADAPLPEADKQALIKLYEDPDDYLGDMPKARRADYLKTISYDDFLTQHAKLPEKAREMLDNICLEYWGFATDGLPALTAFEEEYPGLSNLGLEESEDKEEIPYIYHFPDGNASVARMLVKRLIPNVVSNPEIDQKKPPMEAILFNRFDYSKLDQADQKVNLRLNSTVIQVANQDDGQVAIGYITTALPQNNPNQEKPQLSEPKKITAKHCILAGNHRMMAYIAPEFSPEKKAAMAEDVRVPMIYGKVLVKNWHAFKKLGVNEIYCPQAPYCLVQLDDPVNIGEYQFAKTPDDPMVIHMVRVCVPYGTKKGVREACKMGRVELYTQSYEALEKQMLDQLRDIFAQAGETLDDKILAVTINRWAHGYSYEENELFDTPEAAEKIKKEAQAPVGNIHIANSDANWQPYLEGATQQAWRAVGEIEKQSI